MFFGNYCSLGSQSCLKHLMKLMKLSEYQRSGSSEKQLGYLEPKFI